MKNNFILVFFIFLIACKPYYSAQKLYSISEKELLTKSSSLDFANPMKLVFSGFISDSVRTYKINGIIKIESQMHYQIVMYSRTIGIEIGRVSVNKDSILFIDKIGKRFYSGTIDDLRYLNAMGLNGTDYLKIFLGRSINYGGLLKDSLIESAYSYKSSTFDGNIVVNNFGFLKSQSIETDEFKFNLEYFNYRVNTDIPSRVTAYIKLKELAYNIEYSFSEVGKFDSKLEQFIIPNGYKELL